MLLQIKVNLISLLYFIVAYHGQGLGNERFTVYYPEGYRSTAEWTLAYLEQYYRHVDWITGHRPGRLFVVIEDCGAESNGFTDPTAQSLHLFAHVPYPDFHFGAVRSWWRTLSVHEYTHFSHLTNVRGPVRYLRYLLGRAWLPNAVSALYMYEGITVLTESSILSYEGRLNDGYFDAYADWCGARGHLPSQNYLAHVPENYPDGHLPYLLGGLFIEDLAGGSALALAETDTSLWLSRYLNLYSGCNPLNILGYDQSAVQVWGRPRHALYQQWSSRKTINARYRLVPGRQLITGYELAHLTAADSGLYVCRRVNRPLSFDYQVRYEEIVFIDPHGGNHCVLKGNFSQPIRCDQGSIYVGLSRLKSGYANYSWWGHGRETAIYQITGGKKKKIVTGPIRTFAVHEGNVYYVQDHGLDAGIYVQNRLAWIVNHMVIQDLAVRENGDLIFIGYEEGDGNDLYCLSPGQPMRRLTDHDCSISGLTVDRGRAYFSANEGGRWRPYCYDLENGEFYLLNSDDLAVYPVCLGDRLYYITFAGEAEAVKEVSYQEQKTTWVQRPETVPYPAPASSSDRSAWENLMSLLWPDVSLPYYLPGTDSRAAVLGGIIIGHDALGRHEYYLAGQRQSDWDIDAMWQCHFLPPVQLTVRGSDDSAKSVLMIDYLAWYQDNGFLRRLTISPAVYYGARLIDGRISGALRPEIRSELDWYLQARSSYSGSSDQLYRAGLIVYQPVGFGIIVPQAQAGYAENRLTVGFPSGAEIQGRWGLKAGMRLTRPLAAPTWGLDFPHFFLERIWGSMEIQSGAGSDEAGDLIHGLRYNLLGYATFRLSVLSGFLKSHLSFGAVYDPAAETVLKPYFQLQLDILSLLDHINERSRAQLINEFPDPRGRLNLLRDED